MLMRAKHAIVALGNDERGFSLVEMLVATLGATVVAGALFAVLIFSTSQTTTLTDKVQANQLGRLAMTKIVDELHSACLSPKSVPIQEKSNANELYFVTAYSNQAVITEAQLHRIVWSSTANTLTDYSVKSSSGEAPSFTFPTSEPATGGVLLASNVSQIGTTPIFQYFNYAEESNESETTPTSTLNTKADEYTKVGGKEFLGEKEAQKAASVLISFSAAPADGKTTLNRSLAISSQTTFAFSVPNAETPVHDSPCQ